MPDSSVPGSPEPHPPTPDPDPDASEALDPEQLSGDYLDDDPDGMWQPPPNVWDRARHGEQEALARQRTRLANRDGYLEPQVPVAKIPSNRPARLVHQVNFRTTEGGYEDLTQAASIFGISRAALATVLVRDGVFRILREHARTLRTAAPADRLP